MWSDAEGMKRLAGTLDLLIATVPDTFPMQPFMDVLKLDATLVNVGALNQLEGLSGMALGFGRKSLAGFADDRSFVSVLVSNLLSRPQRLQPNAPLPSVKTDLKALDGGSDKVIWLGHSTYFVQIGGKKILIDPVFSPSTAPVSFSTRAFDGTTL